VFCEHSYYWSRLQSQSRRKEEQEMEIVNLGQSPLDYSYKEEAS